MEYQNVGDITLPPSQAYIGQWSVDRYTQLIRWKVIMAAMVAAALIVFHVPPAVTMLGEVLFFMWIGERVSQARGDRVEGLTAGAMAGLGVGVVVTIAKLAIHPSAILGLNIIVETVLTGVVGSLLAASATIIKTKILPSRTNSYAHPAR